MIKIVIDANVYVSSLIKYDGTPNKLLRSLITSDQYVIVVCEQIIAELGKILYYPKVRKYTTLSNKELQDWLLSLELIVETVNINPLLYLSPIVLTDPADDIYILAAIASKAKYIISGDKHLLSLNPYQEIQIFNPIEFYQILNKGKC